MLKSSCIHKLKNIAKILLKLIIVILYTLTNIPVSQRNTNFSKQMMQDKFWAEKERIGRREIEITGLRSMYESSLRFFFWL